MLRTVFTMFTKHKQARNITKPQRKEIGILPADSIHTTASIRFDVSLYPTEFRGSMSGTSCNQCVEVFTMLLHSSLTFSPSVHVVYRVPMPQGLYCAEDVQRRKGIMKKLSEQKNGGRKGLRRHVEQGS